MFDDDDFGFEEAMAFGTGYAFLRHGQDRQTEALIEALDRPVEVHLDPPEDPTPDPINNLDYTTANMPREWDDYIGQEPLKLRMLVHIQAALARKAPLPHTLLASGYPGVGKGHDLNTNLLTPTGWRRLGDLEIGDQVVGSNGRPTTITDIYERGVLPLLRVTFSDGSSVRCDPEHLWRVQTKKQRQKGAWRTLATQELSERGLLNSQGRPNWYIPMITPVEHQDPLWDLNLPVEPYLLGVMLGNADFQKGVIALNKADRDIADRIISAPRLRGQSEIKLVEYPTTTALRFRPSGAQVILRAIGQEGVAAADKFVPPAYLTAPVAARRAVLAGLMDTDGGVRNDRGQAQFHTTSLGLAGGVRTLVQSLGGTARVRVLKRGEIRVDILLNENPFRSQRKAALWKIPTRGPSRSIVSIEPENEAEVWCIRVDAPDHLYVTEQYIVTHNTTMARLLADALGVRIHELVPPFRQDTLVRAAQQLGDRDILFIDEIHKLADSGSKNAEILLKVLEDRVAHLPDGSIVRLNQITIIGATTEPDKLPETVLDRFKIKPYFQAYSLEELGRIAISFAFRHRAEEYVTDRLAFVISGACRDTPRICEEMILACQDLALANDRTVTPDELLTFLEVEADGLNRTHVHYLTAMRQYFGRESRTGDIEFIVGEAAIQQILRETKQGIGRVERFLIERGLIDRTPRGRRLTQRGIDRAEQFIQEGKGVTHVA